MLPMAQSSPTSARVPRIFTRTCVPTSIVVSSLLVNCGGVALGSHLTSCGINFPKERLVSSILVEAEL